MRKSPFEQFLDDLYGGLQHVPFWVGPLVALAVYAALTWLVPWALTTDGSDPMAKVPADVFRVVAPRLALYFAGAVLLVWLFAEARKWLARLTRPRDPAPPPNCPACGAAMHRRTARQGPHAGSNFWGCSRFPACRGTRPI
jgi:hypothetical protein